MTPITAEEAYARTNPSDPEEVRNVAAQNIISGVAANDAYVNSRTEMEQLAIRMRGGQHPPTFAEQNAENAGEQLPAVDASATEIAPQGESDRAQLSGSPADAEEIASLKARLAELEGQH